MKLHPATRRLASNPSEWLSDLVGNRQTCPEPRCDGGAVAVVIERASRWYPGWSEDRPCERCGGLGYLPRVWRRAMGGAA